MPPTSPADFVIEAEGLGKTYRIWDRPASRLLAPSLESLASTFPKESRPARWLARRAHRHYRDFHALSDVSFRVQRGDALGIVGRNGSGKSTLLQVITGTLQATTGASVVRGRVAALLELGSGFNPEFSGRENIFLNATVLGLTRKEAEARFDSIAAFADIGDFLEQPVKTYSSGMAVRLAFAVAAHVEPEILVIDEALSVGDARFQLKCARRIEQFRESGGTLLFVSHSLGTVKSLCSHAMLLEKGRCLYLGLPNDVANLYSKLMADGGTAEALAEDIAELNAARSVAATEGKVKVVSSQPGKTEVSQTGPVEPAVVTALRHRVRALETVLRENRLATELGAKVEALMSDERRQIQISNKEYSYGGELGRIHEILVLDEEGQKRTWFDTGEVATFRIRVEAFDDFPEPIFALIIRNTAGVDVYATNTLFSKQPADPIAKGAWREVDFVMPMNIMHGTYFVSLGFTHFFGNELAVLHRRYDAIQLEIHKTDMTFGIANLWARISARAIDPVPAAKSP